MISQKEKKYFLRFTHTYNTLKTFILKKSVCELQKNEVARKLVPVWQACQLLKKACLKKVITEKLTYF
jgi:hypothetical protein